MEDQKPQNELINIQITEAAKNYFNQILLDNQIEKSYGIEISIISGGCSGFQYEFNFNDLKYIFNDDIYRIADKPCFIYIDKFNLEALNGSIIDIEISEIETKIIINNPNAKQNCGCGRSFS